MSRPDKAYDFAAFKRRLRKYRGENCCLRCLREAAVSAKTPPRCDRYKSVRRGRV